MPNPSPTSKNHLYLHSITGTDKKGGNYNRRFLIDRESNESVFRDKVADRYSYRQTDQIGKFL